MRHCFFVFMLLIARALFAEEPDDFLKIELAECPEEVTVGEPIDYIISISGADLGNVSISFPDKKEVYPSLNDEESNELDSIIPIYIINSVKRKEDSNSESESVHIMMNISFYRTGGWLLPEIDIIGADGVKAGYKVPFVTVKALNPSGEFQESEPPLDAGRSYTRLLLLLFLILALLAFSIVLWKRKKKGAELDVKPESAFDFFLKELELFDAHEFIRQRKIDDYAFGISGIFRRFLSKQFGFDASEMTSLELSRYLAKLLRSPKYYGLVDEINSQLNLWDLSKFAEFMPSEDTMLSSHEKIIKIVKRLSQ